MNLEYDKPIEPVKDVIEVGGIRYTFYVNSSSLLDLYPNLVNFTIKYTSLAEITMLFYGF